MSTNDQTTDKQKEALNKQWAKMIDPAVMGLNPAVPFRFMNQDLSLEMNNLALMGILKDTGINILGDGFKATQLDNPDVIGSVLFHALIQNHPSTTQELVNRNINARQFMYIRERIMQALSVMMPDERESMGDSINREAKTIDPPE